MPESRRPFALSAAYIEVIHDFFVSAWWPNIEPVGPGEYRDEGLVQSAVARPFQAVFGRELFPTILEKSAALFHSLIADHPFENGNKRTAVIALDLFMAANGLFLYLDNERMYRMAKDTASYVPQGITHEGMLARIGAELRGSSIRIAKMKEAGLETSVIRTVRDVRKYVREHPYNSAAQEQFFGLDARLPSN